MYQDLDIGMCYAKGIANSLTFYRFSCLENSSVCKKDDKNRTTSAMIVD